MIANNACKMISVTSGNFTSEAIAFAVDKRLWLVNGSQLVYMVEDGRSFHNKTVVPEPENVSLVEIEFVLIVDLGLCYVLLEGGSEYR